MEVGYQKESCPSCKRPFRVYTRYVGEGAVKRVTSINYEKRFGEDEECGNCFLKNNEIELLEGGRGGLIKRVMHHVETATAPKTFRPQVIPSLMDDSLLKTEASLMIKNINERLLSKGWDFERIYQFWSDEIERGKEQMINS
jgi:hypothetical protein